MSAEELGQLLRAARLDAGSSLSRMAELTHFSKSYLGQVETGTRAVTPEVLEAYGRALGAAMWRREITHPRLVRVKGTQRLVELVRSVQSGRPDAFGEKPTAHATDIAVGTRMDPDGVRQFRKWMTEGETATLRTNSLSVIATVPGRENAELVIDVLENDPRGPAVVPGVGGVPPGSGRLADRAAGRRRHRQPPGPGEARPHGGEGSGGPEGHREPLVRRVRAASPGPSAGSRPAGSRRNTKEPPSSHGLGGFLGRCQQLDL